MHVKSTLIEKDSQKEMIAPGKHICVVSTATLSKGNPVSVVHEKLLLIFVVERETGIIVDFDVNTASMLTAKFIRSIFVGKNLITQIDEIKKSVQQNYLGDSAKAMIVASLVARQRLLDHIKSHEAQKNPSVPNAPKGAD
ncbi:hypothetical protein CE91St46_26830 [Eubacteriales bacterium]|nr:hypothetical protein CE91St46_26830 [Eubacteriales bacterium]GKH64291.1 hypothetical protein CE91St47_27600 [Eubacteriales bacterium]